MDEFGELAGRFRQSDAVADKNDRPLRFEDQIDTSRNLIRGSAAALRVQRRRRPWHFNVTFFLKDIEGHVEIHGTGPARKHCRRRLTQRERQHIDARRLETALDDRPNDVGKSA